MSYIVYKSDELYHYGIKGMKWGIRHDNGCGKVSVELNPNTFKPSYVYFDD